MKLSDIPAGTICTVASTGGDLTPRLLSMGISAGAKLKVIRSATKFSGVIVEAEDALVALRKEAAELIEVEIE